MNQPRGNHGAIIYTSDFGATTRTKHDGCEILVKNNKITSIHKQKGNSSIPVNGFVYSISNDTIIRDIQKISIGQSANYKHKVHMRWRNKTYDIAKMDYCMSGAELLVSASQTADTDFDFNFDKPIIHGADEIAADFSQKEERSKLINAQHPRTWSYLLTNPPQDRSGGSLKTALLFIIGIMQCKAVQHTSGDPLFIP